MIPNEHDSKIIPRNRKKSSRNYTKNKKCDLKKIFKDELKEDFKPILDQYDVIEYLGKGSYGVVAKVMPHFDL